MKCSIRMATGILWMAATVSCRTSDSTQQALPVNEIKTLSLQEWTTACQAELDNPASRAATKKHLQAIAQTDDCATAYAPVKALVDSYLNRQ